MPKPRVLAVGGIALFLVLLLWYLVLWSPKQQAYDKAHADVQSSAAAIPPTPDIAQLIDQVDAAATQSGVTFVSIAPSEPSPSATVSGGPTTIGVAIDATGGYYQVIDFINRLDSMPRLMVINGVNVAPGGTSELTLTLSTDVFTSRPVSAPTTTTTTAPAPTTSTTAAP